ncbi:MAG TPA: phospholipid carrier-dependent glycosyltransferase [Flavipsychrobacter sp.]|nr:phospholipid carrier-dependent glycosyltransferase [Flavipsychrobacter sp.]
MSSISAATNKSFRLAFIVTCALLLIIMPLLSKDYGQSGDEWLQIIYGQDIWNYFVHGNQQALDYSNKPLQYDKMELYGGLYDFSMEAMHQMMPSIPVLHLRHFFNALSGAIMMMFTGLFAYRLSGKNWMAGLIALLFIAFSPRIFGESMNNPKDIPFACGFIVGVYGWFAFLQDLPKKMWKNALCIALGFGLAFGVRSAGGLLMGAYFIVMTALYYFFNNDFRAQLKADNNKLLKKAVLFILGALALGYIIGLVAWPWGLQSPISNPLLSLKEMSQRSVVLRVFFEGVYRPNNALPWYYEFKWIVMSNPLIVIASVLTFFALILKARKEYGIFVVAFLLFAAFFPPLYMIYKKSSVHDTWRHLFFIYPFIVLIAALGINLISGFVSKPHLKILPLAVAIIGLLPAIIWTFKSHPNQYVYFNELEGGVKGAFGYYDIDYYQNSALQDAKWIMKNGKKPDTSQKILVASNMLGFEQYFARDTNRLSFYYVRFNERHKKDWDYYVTYSRFVSPEQLQNEKWPPANIVYEVKEDDVVLSAVIERKSKAGITAAEALEKKDFATAARLYSDYVKADATDENAWINFAIALASIGNIDGGIEAAKKAAELDAGNPQFYQILAQLYQAKGDNGNAQQAMNQANSLIMREQEFAE